jgi:hypothetical protein
MDNITSNHDYFLQVDKQAKIFCLALQIMLEVLNTSEKTVTVILCLIIETFAQRTEI